MPVHAGDAVLVHAAAGGVGSILSQWARHLEATVIGTVGSQGKVAAASANGCHHVVLYTEGDFVARVNEITGGEGVRVAYDGVGRSTFHRNFGCLATFGANVLFGSASGKVEPVDVNLLNGRSHSIAYPSVGHYAGTPQLFAASADALFSVVRSGEVKVPVAHRYALEDASRAHADLEARRTAGSIVLEVGGSA